MKKTLASIALSVAVALLAAPARAEEVFLPVQPMYQEENNWCWAATAVSVFNRYQLFPGVDVDVRSDGDLGQCLVASNFTGEDCCGTSDPACDLPITSVELKSILKAAPYRLASTVYSRSFTLAELDKRLKDSGAPVVALIAWKGTSNGHFLTITGYTAKAGQDRVLTFADSGDGEHHVRGYVEFKNNKDFLWTESITLDASPPADVDLRYTTLSDGYKYMATGELTLGPELWLMEDTRVPIEATWASGGRVAFSAPVRAFKGIELYVTGG